MGRMARMMREREREVGCYVEQCIVYHRPIKVVQAMLTQSKALRSKTETSDSALD